MAQQLALGGEERLRAMRLEQGLIGDVQPQLERLLGWAGAWPARDSFWYSLAKRWLASCQAPAATAS